MAGPDTVLDPVRLSRLRWRCRRGMLENDLLLARFLDARGTELTEGEVVRLDALLELPDQELWDVLSGRRPPADPALAPLVAALAAPPTQTPSQMSQDNRGPTP